MSHHGQKIIPFGCLYILILGRSKKQRRVIKHLSTWTVVFRGTNQGNHEDFWGMSYNKLVLGYAIDPS
jgi:hypothetical protein